MGDISHADETVQQSSPAQSGNDVCLPALLWNEAAKQNQCVSVPNDSLVAEAYGKVAPSVAKIEATRPGWVPFTEEKSSGSGFVVDKSGLILTSDHVINGFNNITVTMSDGQKYNATIAAEDRKNDAVVLRIAPPSGTQYAALDLDQSSAGLRMNQDVLLFGHPLGWDGVYLSHGQVDGATTVAKVQPAFTAMNPPEEDPNRKVIAVAAHGEDGSSGEVAFSPDTGKVIGMVDMANEKNSTRGDHVFVTPVEPLNELIERARRT